MKWDRTVSNVIFSLFKYTFLYSRHKKTHEYILTTPHEKEVYLHKAYLLTAWTGTAITYLTSAHQFFLIYQFWGILGIVEICKTANSVDFFFFLWIKSFSLQMLSIWYHSQALKINFDLPLIILVSMTLSILFQTIGLCFPQEEEHIERPNQILSSLRQGIDDQDIRRRVFQQQ